MLYDLMGFIKTPVFHGRKSQQRYKDLEDLKMIIPFINIIRQEIK